MEAHYSSVSSDESHVDVSSDDLKVDKGPSVNEPGVAPHDLAQVAALLRRAVTSIDTEARERLEAAWVAFTSAIKQPHHDASRVAARLNRLRGEIDRILSGQSAGGGGDSEDSNAGSDR